MPLYVVGLKYMFCVGTTRRICITVRGVRNPENRGMRVNLLSHVFYLRNFRQHSIIFAEKTKVLTAIAYVSH